MKRQGLAALVLGMFGCWAHAPVRSAREPVRENAADAAVASADARACQNSDVKACGRTAERYWEGQHGHTYDPVTSFGYAALGCQAGDGLACALLGRQYETGIGAAWEPQTALVIYERSCNAGSGLGCFLRGAMYLHAHGVDEDLAKGKAYQARAREIWLAACQGDEPRACTFAASLTERDGQPSARELEQRACDHGVARGCVDLLVERAHDARQVDAASRELDKWCRGGEPSACEELAWIYRSDVLGHPRDPLRAAELTERSCELGDEAACVLAGIFYELGEGVLKNRTTRWHYFELACNRGASRGCLYLAQDIMAIPGLQVNAVTFAQRGCQIGNGEACALLATRYFALHQDAAAVRWDTEACRQSSRSSCLRLLAHDAELPRLSTDTKRSLYQGACEMNLSSGCRYRAQLEQDDKAMAQAVLDAVTKQDAMAFAKLAPDGLDVRGLWFPTPDCARQFSGIFTLAVVQQRAFLQCLSTLGLHVAPPGSLTGAWTLMYEPGVTLLVRAQDGVLQGIWAPPLPPDESIAVPIDPDALASHRISGAHVIEPDQALRDLVARSPKASFSVDLFVCVDPTGKVDDVRVVTREAIESFRHAAEDVARTWTFRPFQAGGKAIRVCALDHFSYPPGRESRGDRPAPQKPTGKTGPGADLAVAPHNVSPIVLDAGRIAGDKNIVPDDPTKTAISLSGSPKVIGSFKVCITEHGRIASVTVLKSTTFDGYDHTIERGLRTWRYRPFLVDGEPAPVCTAVTYIYSQR